MELQFRFHYWHSTPMFPASLEALHWSIAFSCLHDLRPLGGVIRIDAKGCLPTCTVGCGTISLICASCSHDSFSLLAAPLVESVLRALRSRLHHRLCLNFGRGIRFAISERGQ